MITLVCGAEDGCHAAKQREGEIAVLNVSNSGALLSFCRRVIFSARTLKLKQDSKERVVANDSFKVIFPKNYLIQAFQHQAHYLKMAAVIEVAMDLDLNVRVLVVDAEVWENLLVAWPQHWPQLEKVWE